MALANPIYTVCIRHSWQGNRQVYGHIRCTFMVLAKPHIHTYIQRMYRVSSRGRTIHTGIYGVHIRRVGQIYIRCVYGIPGRETAKYTVTYGQPSQAPPKKGELMPLS